MLFGSSPGVCVVPFPRIFVHAVCSFSLSDLLFRFDVEKRRLLLLLNVCIMVLSQICFSVSMSRTKATGAVEGIDDIIVDFDRPVDFDEVMEWVNFLGEAGYEITIVNNKSKIPLDALFVFRKRQFLKVVSDFVRLRGNASPGETVRPRKLTSLAQNWHLAFSDTELFF